MTGLQLLCLKAKAHDKKAIQILFERYYYHVDRCIEMYQEYDGVKEIAEDILLNAILSYKNSKNKAISCYIYEKFINFEKKIDPEKNYRIDNDLLKYKDLAFLGDVDARKNIMLKYLYIADFYAKDYYQFYRNIMSVSSDNYTVSLDDIKQNYYILLFNYINRFYDNPDNNNSYTYISTFIHKYFADRQMSKIHNIYRIIKVESLEDNLSFISDDEIENVENNVILDNIELNISGKVKELFYLLRKGYNYQEIANIWGCTRSNTQRMGKRLKQIVKKNEIQF